MTNHAPQPGDLIGQKYQIQKLIGEGGFSRVYLATHQAMGRPVALKILRPPGGSFVGGEAAQAQAQSFAYRFEQEAQVLSRLKSPATVTVYDYGQTEQGSLFMVLEYLDGKTLDQVIRQEAPMSAARVARILRQALESLREAHYYGILHRDIKPTNMILYEHLNEPDFVKLLDFGIAKLFQEQQVATPEHARTKTGVVVGTPRYIAPEMIENSNALPASDIFSLGLVCYEMLTGHHANRGKTPLEIISFQVSPEPILLPPELLIPNPLRLIIERMLHKSLQTRWGDAAQIIDALRREKLGEAYDAQRFEETMPSMSVSAELLAPPVTAADAVDDDAATSEYNALPLSYLSAPMPRKAQISEPLPVPPSALVPQSLDEPTSEIVLDQDISSAIDPGGHLVAKPQGELPPEWDEGEITDVTKLSPGQAPPKEERLIVLTQKKPAPQAAQQIVQAPAAASMPSELEAESIELERLKKNEKKKAMAILATLLFVIVAVLLWMFFGR